jgi:formylmethanofuran dehydrogenase subunit B
MTDAALREDVVCPFCALGCDDLVIEAQGTALRVREHGCERSRAGFERPLGPVGPRVDGEETSLEAAVGRAAGILKKSRLPLIAGLATDTEGTRAALGLAERLGGVVDHLGSAGTMPNLLAMQSGGWVTGTLAEVRNRAQLVVFVGTDAVSVMPRFQERVLRPERTLGGVDPAARRLVYLGQDLVADAAGARPALIIPCAMEHLHEVVAALRALIGGRTLGADTIAGVPRSALEKLAADLRACPYSAIVWAAGALPGPHGDLLVGSLGELLKTLNGRTRAVGLPLAGPDNVTGVNQVCVWQTGVPLRTSLATGVPDYDPARWTTAALLDAGTADALLWITSFWDRAPPRASVPTIVLGRPGQALDPEPDVVIPVGTPGLDHAGSLFRTDGTVALPLRRLRATDLPSVAGVLALIERHLGDRADGSTPC